MTLYRHAGVAVAFSPRLDALLAEVALRRPYLAETFSLIHVGQQTPEKEARLWQALVEAGLPEETPIHWTEGAPDEAILSAVDAHGMDLLLAGALERERPLRYYLGSVAHNLVREAPCSLVLFTEPQTQPRPMRRLVVVTDYSEHALIALVKALRLAEREGAERVFVVRVLSVYGEAMVMAEGMQRERARKVQAAALNEERALLQDFIDAAGRTVVPVEAACIEGRPGPAEARFAREHEADLLVVPSSQGFGHFFERLIPSNMEWLLREIPCNLWVVRERLTMP